MISDSRRRALREGVSVRERQRFDLREITWQTQQMARSDRRALPWIVVVALGLLSIAAWPALSGNWASEMVLTLITGFLGLALLFGAAKMPSGSRRKLAETQALARTGTLVPARAMTWSEDWSEGGGSRSGTTRLRITVPDYRNVTVSHHCSWSSCKDAGRRGSTDRSVTVVLDLRTGIWAVVHSGYTTAVIHGN